MKKYIYSAIVCATMLVAFPTYTMAATTFDWTPCKKEISLWCKAAGEDEAMYACLHGGHDSELSKGCDDKAVTPYEDKTGKPHG